MSKLAIKVENVSKTYSINRNLGNDSYSLRKILNSPFSASKDGQASNLKSEVFFALQDISFDVYHGESVGLIGRNGAGKSTLLKILSRITRPSTGKITLFEKISSLLEIGTGFNVELSGRDNIYLNGSFLGMHYSEIKSKFDEIVEFSEIEKFIDTPVKYYSSGMYIRLAFSIAVNLSPELLLLDEVLSVGDAGFQKKSKEKMNQLLRSGATIIFVSHDEQAIKELCNRAIWLENGKIRVDGPVENTLKMYCDHFGTISN